MHFQISHTICDLGLAITKRLVQKDVDLQELSHLMSLPPMLYKAFEKKEGGDTMVCYFFGLSCMLSILVHIVLNAVQKLLILR